MNPIILPIIVKHLPIRCLPRLRSTNKLWNSTIVPEYRKRTANNKFCFIHVGEDTKQAAFDKLNECSQVPWGAYEFENISFTSREVQNLITKVGGIMSRLILSLTRRDAYLPIAVFRTLVLQQCPVLEELSITDSRGCATAFWKRSLAPPPHAREQGAVTLPHLRRIILDLELDIEDHESETYTSFPLVTDLLLAASNLEVLKINDSGTNGLIFDILKQKQELGKIRCINFGQDVFIANLQGLIELSSRKSNCLHPKKLNILQFLGDDCFTDPVGQTLLKQFLTLQGSSLESLTASLTEDDEDPTCKIHLPGMSSLKSLKLQIEYFTPTPTPRNNNNGQPAAAPPVDNEDNVVAGSPIPNITFDSLDINFPNLTKLVLMDMNWIRDADQDVVNASQQWTHFINQLGSHTGVTHLSLYIFDDTSYLIDLASRFPNVKTLNIEFSDKLSSDVCCLWSKLEKMDIHLVFWPEEEFDVDSWITGIPTETCKYLTSSFAEAETKVKGEAGVEGEGSKMKMMKEYNWKESKTSPGISDLHELREFNLDFGWISERVYVTDLSGYYGFLANPAKESHLRRIYICSGSNFSKEVVADVQVALGPHGDFVPFDETVRHRLDEDKRIGGRRVIG